VVVVVVVVVVVCRLLCLGNILTYLLSYLVKKYVRRSKRGFVKNKHDVNTSRASNTGRGSDVIVLIEAGGFYSRKYGNIHFCCYTITYVYFHRHRHTAAYRCSSIENSLRRGILAAVQCCNETFCSLRTCHFHQLKFLKTAMHSLIHYLRQGGYIIVVVCLSVSNFAQNLQNGFV